MARVPSSSLMICLFLVVTVFVGHVTAVCDAFGKKCDAATNSTDDRCGMCGGPISMMFVLQNELVNPKFMVNTTVLQQPQRQMIYFLEKAAQQNKAFEFSSYYYSTLGYFMTAIGGLAQNPQRNFYWMFSSGGVPLNKGLSSYVVNNNEIILINYTYTGN